MEADQPVLFAGRYQLEDQPDGLLALDTQPWSRCWSCGSTDNISGEVFCTECGASLDKRRYRAIRTPAAAPVGPALIARIDDQKLRALLPQVWDQVEDGDELLTLLVAPRGEAPTPPLAETPALQLGLALTRLLKALHSEGLVMGKLHLADLTLAPDGSPELANTPALASLPDETSAEAISSDLQALAALLEALTSTPRTTRRLGEDEAAALAAGDEGENSALAEVLSQVRTGTIATSDALIAQFEELIADRTQPIPLRHIVGAATDVGVVRDHNEDSYLVVQLGLDNDGRRQGWGCYLVSDGMGGHAAGELASGLAIRGAGELILNEYLARAMVIESSFVEEEAASLVKRAILQANQSIVEAGQAAGNDMGATLTMALVVGDRAIIGNVGDSRTYLLREGKLRRVSKDHSLVMRLVDIGQIREEDIYSHPQRNAVLRSLGDRLELEVDIFSERMHPGDALFLCSDGQWEMTRDHEMEQIIAKAADVQTACDALVAAANKAGGEDNITAVIVRFAE